MMVDLFGRPQAEIIRLGDPEAKIDPERRNQWRGPRLSAFTGLTSFGWACRAGDGAQGNDAIDLVMYLGSCGRGKAIAWLESTLSRIVEIEPR